MRLIHIFFGCFILWARVAGSETAYYYGLAFHAYEVEKDERTALNLTPETPFSFSNGFVMEFEVSFTKVLHNFGYIFRIIDSNNQNIDLLLSRTRAGHILEPQFTAIYHSGQLLCNQLFEDVGMDFDQWVKVKVMLDSSQGIFSLVIKDKVFEKTDVYFKSFKKVHIVFGKNDIISYETSDVPAMSLRDISIKDIKGKEKYRWKLAKHTGQGVYDEIQNHFASCKAPKWMLDSHSYWKKDTVFVVGPHPQVTFNREANEVAIVDHEDFYTYDVTGRALQKYPNTAGIPMGNKSNNLKYNISSRKYFTYNFADKVACYDMAAHTWSNEIPEAPDSHPHYWHHNSFIDTENDVMYLFGGYGFHIYKNDIHKYDFKSATWERTVHQGDTIAPRYLAGLGALNNKKFLLFGGYGSEKGDQELSPRNYYDLFTFDVKTLRAKKVWELNPTQHNFVVANSLVVDTVDNCFYALCFPHQKFHSALQLYRFSLDKPAYEVLADSIPYPFNDACSFADLYLSKDGKELVAVTSYTDNKTMMATVSVYSLAFPPMHKMNLVQHKPNRKIPWGYTMIVLFLPVIFYLIILWRSKNKKQPDTPGITHKHQLSEITGEDETPANPIVGIKPLQDKYPKQSILLFGGFQVIDKESKKITGEFTPTLKQLFLLILLHTLKDGKGISSVKLREILWFDKTSESAKNNRGVSISKLRVIFEKIGHVSIHYANSYWTVEFGDDIYCDYYEASILMKRLEKEVDLKDINRLVSIVSTGELLPNVETEWADAFKSDFSNKLIDFLLGLTNRATQYQITSSMMINIADAIFAHDSLNEDALKIKCTLLVEMGKNRLAQKTYLSFTKEYQSLFGADYKHAFEQVIS